MIKFARKYSILCPTHQPDQLRTSLTKTVPKARIIPNKVVMQTKGDQYERWKQATSKELQVFLKTAWKEPTAETKARYFARKQKVVMQLLDFTMKPMTAEKRALGLQGDEYEKARICLQGQNHEGFQIHNSTNNADAHLVRLFLSVYASSKNVLASFDVRNAFLNAEFGQDVVYSGITKNSVKKRNYITVLCSHTAPREKLQVQLRNSWLPRKNSNNHYITVMDSPRNMKL